MFGKAVQLFILLNIIIYSQSVEFRNYSVQDGLSNNKVNCVIQDRQGFIWFGTEDGLNRFDGYEFKVFRPSEKKNSISSKDIWSLFEDNDGNIWIGTKSGDINKYDIKTRKFSSWKIEEVKINDNSITAIYIDSSKNAWIGTYQQGLFKFNSKGEKTGHWEYNPEDRLGISNNFITSIVEDRNKKLWIGTYFGLNEFNPAQPERGFTKYILKDKSINNNLIWELRLSKINQNKLWLCKASGLSSIDVITKDITVIDIPPENSIQFFVSVSDIVESIEEGEAILYAGTYGGIVRVDLKNGYSTRFLQDANNPMSLINNQVNQLILDKSGVIWFATENGISSLSLRYNFIPSQKKIISENLKVLTSDVKAVIINENDNVFVGTSKGLYDFNLKSFTENKISQIGDLNIWSLFKEDDQLWIGTYGQGLYNFNLKSNRLTKIKIDYPLFQTQAYNFIKCIKDDKKGNLYLGTWGGGLVKLNKKTNEVKFWRSNKNVKGTISFNDVWSIVIDKSGRIWLGTNGGGLNYFDTEKNIFYALTTENTSGNLKSNSILDLYESINSSADKNGNTTLWICHDYGLTKLILRNTDNFSELKNLIISSKTYNTESGLTSEVIKSIIEDENGNLWVSTSNGIFIYDNSTDKFSRLPFYLERKYKNYNSGASLKILNKNYLFGSNEGLKIFTPSDIKTSEYKPNVIISDFQLFNTSVFDDPEKLASIYSDDGITLSYDQNVLTFNYTSIDFNNPASIKYAFMLKGFDKDWNYIENKRFVTYTNLNPGEYEFLVKATNSDGLWNDIPTAVKVIISPPWWRTVWAYITYIFLFFAGILLIRRLEIKKAKLINEIKMKNFETEKLREVEAMKSRFFANISHELRTPLMLIKGPIDELLNKNSNTNVAELAELAARNSEKLKSLIDQLLELTQLESAKIPVKAVYENIIEFSKNILWSFKNLADQKQIELIFESEEEKIMAWFDKDILEKILNNILSNSLKFTNPQGKIGIKISCPKSDVNQKTVIKIFDTGIGIDEKDVNKVFDRFYQSTESIRKNYAGFGIGLSLVKELVDLHKWEIRLLSEKMKGTEFLISIPLNDYLDETQKMKEKAPLHSIEEISEPIIKSNEVEDANNDDDSGKFTLMIVEDSEDVRYYLSSLLKNQYKLILAENGLDAINKSLEQLPDLIISDIMMPEMDGLEFCQRIKNDWRTSHIPVILLTAKITTENKIEGLELGADDYITKPFNPKELSIRIKNLLKQRKLLREKFSKSIKINPDDFNVNHSDKDFIEKAIQVVNDNIDNPDFSTEIFAGKMFLSRSQFHRKFQQVVKETPGEFIRTIRLKKAAQLLLEKEFNITQISLEVGFQSVSHFSKAFKQFFSCTPSEFIKNDNKSHFN